MRRYPGVLRGGQEESGEGMASLRLNAEAPVRAHSAFLSPPVPAVPRDRRRPAEAHLRRLALGAQRGECRSRLGPGPASGTRRERPHRSSPRLLLCLLCLSTSFSRLAAKLPLGGLGKGRQGQGAGERRGLEPGLWLLGAPPPPSSPPGCVLIPGPAGCRPRGLGEDFRKELPLEVLLRGGDPGSCEASGTQSDFLRQEHTSLKFPFC